jgi:glycine dehydrogenase
MLPPNLHKTFAPPWRRAGWPHRVAAHQAPFCPGPPPGGDDKPRRAVSAARWARQPLPLLGICHDARRSRSHPIPIRNANYIARRLEKFFPVLYRGRNGLVAHECILDLRQFKSVTVEDVAKRLMDYGFHAPTISWPVPGTIMVEPTESEPLAELDRFCEAMIGIHAEIQAIESGQTDRQNNLLKQSPHTADMIAVEKWERPYSREQACFPVPSLRDHKFWPPVGRIDNVYGDRNLVCTCAGMEAYGA